MGVHPVGEEDDLGTDLPDDLRDRGAVLDGVHQVAVGKRQGDPAVDPEGARRGFALRAPPLRRSHRGRLAVGEVEDHNAVSLLDEGRDRPAHPDLRIVGMGADHEEFRHRLTSRSMIER